MKAKLTRAMVDRAKPEATPYKIHDTELRGLFLRVQPSGVKTYYVAFGRNQDAPLGRWPVMTLEQARAEATKALAEAITHGAPLKHKARREQREQAAGERIVTLGDLMKHRYEPWATAERKAGAATVQAIKAQFGTWYGRKLADLTPWNLERFKADRLRAGVSPVTVNRDVVRIKAVMNKAVEWGVLPASPFAGVKRAKVEEDGRVRYLSADEEKRLRAALAAREAKRRKARESGNRWRVERDEEPLHEWAPAEFTDHLMPLVLLAINTGARRGELFGLTWADVDLEARRMTVRAATAKGARTRHIPLNAEAHDVLKRWHVQRDPELARVFPGAGGGQMTNINKSWAELVAAADLADFRFHDCRHHFASRLVMAGVDLNTVRELLGHTDIAMTLRYAHLAPEHKAAAVAALDQPRVAGRGR